MRVMHYADNLDGTKGGVVRAVQNIVDCQSREMEVTLAVRTLRDRAALARDEDANVIIVGGPLRLGAALSRSSLEHLDDALDGYDVLHLHSVWSPATVQLARLARRKGLKTCLSPHGSLDAWPLAQKRYKKRAYWSIVRRTLSGFDIVHTTCALEARSVCNRLPGVRVEIVPLPLDEASYRLASMSDQSSDTARATDEVHLSLIFVGRLHEKKRVDKAVDALALLVRHGHDARMTVVGTGAPKYESFIRHRIASLGVANYVDMTGFVDEERRRRLLCDSDVAVAPSEHENFGFVCFEALAAGTPLVTTPGVMTSRELEASGAALVSDGTVSDIARCIQELSDGKTRAAMATSGKRWILKELDRKALVDAYYNMYRSLWST